MSAPAGTAGSGNGSADAANVERDTGIGRSSALGTALRGPLLLVLVGGAIVAVAIAWERAPLEAAESGLLTLVLMGLAALYYVRRRTLRLSLILLRPFTTVGLLRPFRRSAVYLDQTKNWRAAHLVIGLLWALALWWHIGAARGGWGEVLLLAMCAALFASGIIGSIIQFVLPRSLLGIIEREVRVEDVEARRRAIFVQAEERILGGSEPLVDLYLAEIRPALQGDSSSWKLFEATLRRLEPGAVLRGQLWLHLEDLDDDDAATFRELIDLAEQKGRLDLNLSHLKLSVGWLRVHDALVVGTALLVVVHLLSLAYY